MLALATEENFNNDIIRGVLRCNPNLNLVRARDAGLSGADDPVVLKWAAQESRVLFTHAASTITKQQTALWCYLGADVLSNSKREETIMELVVLITVTIVVGALVYIVSQALKH